MATKITNTYTASYELTLQNTTDSNDITKKTISFDVTDDTDSSAVATAGTYFARAGVSTLFQPSNWRDYEGTFDVYKVTSIVPRLTARTVYETDEIITNN